MTALVLFTTLSVAFVSQEQVHSLPDLTHAAECGCILAVRRIYSWFYEWKGLFAMWSPAGLIAYFFPELLSYRITTCSFTILWVIYMVS